MYSCRADWVDCGVWVRAALEYIARSPRDEAFLRAAQCIFASRIEVAVRDSGVSHAYPGTKFVLVRRSASFQPASSVALRDSGMSGS